MPSDSVVLDPFCGSGTIVYEGASCGLRTLGIDANPIAVILSNGKIHIPSDYSDVQNEISSLIDRSKALSEYPHPKEYATGLFHNGSLNEIMRLSTFFEEMSDYVKACYLGAIALTARGCNGYKWTSSTVGKSIEPKRYIPFYRKFEDKARKHFYPVPNHSSVFYHDARDVGTIIGRNSVDFVFSSPPYFDCLDYTAYYAKIIYEILNYDRVAVRNSLIQDFSDYEDDMRTVLNGLYDVVKPGGQVIFVVGDKKVHGKLINGAAFFGKISPFVLVDVIERSYTGTSSQVFDKLNNTERKEQIIVWQK